MVLFIVGGSAPLGPTLSKHQSCPIRKEPELHLHVFLNDPMVMVLPPPWENHGGGEPELASMVELQNPTAFTGHTRPGSSEPNRALNWHISRVI